MAHTSIFPLNIFLCRTFSGAGKPLFPAFFQTRLIFVIHLSWGCILTKNARRLNLGVVGH